MQRFDVTVQVTRATSVQEMSKVFEGLCELQRRGQARVRFEPLRSARDHPRILRLRVETSSTGRELAIDLDDDPHLFDAESLGSADLYFKRSFSRPALENISPELGAKVLPFGLSNPAIRAPTAARILQARLLTGRGLRGLATDGRQLGALPTPADFESEPDLPAEPLVLFQTRMWPVAEDAERANINEERATLVRALRNSFGKRFIGGVVHSPFARQHYGDIITDLPFRMRAYPRLVKRALIGIYTRGLLNSTAFKLSEYLGASRCIVGHSPASELPQPLEPGRHYLPFVSPDECLAQCDRLLRDPAAALAMRRSNWDYYRANVEPGAHLAQLLTRAFQSS